MSWIARLIALALIVVLADATVASIHGTPSALTAVAAGAALAIIGLALFWARAWIAVAFGLLMLIGAFAVGALGGLDNGPALTGLAAADVAAAVFAVAILGGAVVTCVALPYVVARLLVAVLAAYAIIATLASVQHGGLAAAFGSAPLAWTRGTYVAAEALLPLAALTALAYGVIQLTRKHGANGSAALVLAVALLAGAQLGAFAAGAAGLPTLVAFERIPISGILTAADTGPRFVPHGSADVPAEVRAAFANVAGNPQHALEAVAALGDDLYPGALGGSAGALRSGSANSIDKALLLRDVIRSGAPSTATVFAQCSLSPTESDALIAQVRAARAHPKIVMQQAAAAAASATDTNARTTLQNWAQTWTTLVGQTQSEGRQLTTSLQTAGLTLPAGQPTPDRLRAIAAQHVWIRVQVNGGWVDLDPTVEPAAPGKTRCTAQTQIASLPDELYDVLGVRVAMETSRGGQPQRTIVLDRTLRTADIGDRDVSFMFAEPTGMDAGAASAPPPGAMIFTPLLHVGAENIAGTPVALPVPAAGGGGLGKSIGAIGGALGSATPAPNAPPVASVPVVTELWMELSVASPGTDVTHVQSPIFDRIGYAARTTNTAPPVLAAQPESNVYRSMQTVWDIAVSAGNAVSGAGPASVSTGGSATTLSGAMARLNGAYYSLRRALMDDARGAAVGVAAAQPGISLLAVNNGGKLMIDDASDFTIPLTTDEARPAWAAATVLAERELLNGNVAESAGSGTDALAAFDRAATAGTHIIALHSADSTLAATNAIPAEARARMAAHLARGDSLLAMAPTVTQTGGPPYAFWILDPANGTLRDENSFGRHQDMEEEAVEDEEAVEETPKWKKMACSVAAALMIAVTLDSSAAEGKTLEDAQAAVNESQKTNPNNEDC